MASRDPHDARTASALGRRDFLKKTSLGTLVGLMGTTEVRALPPEPLPERLSPFNEDPIGAAIIGYGEWGREIADTLARLPEMNLISVCDTYDVMLKRAKREVGDEVLTTADYNEVLGNDDVKAVFIATPTHLHKDIALAALDAGKHVYLEAPMAASIEDARAIALAAKNASEQVFQVGQQYRSEPNYRSVFQFIRSGALGSATMTRAQWHAKESWRRTSPNAERVQALNWRLDPAVSLGLIGEVGIHQVDMATWILGRRPTAVTGFGDVLLWTDGREVADTIQTIFEFGEGVNMMYDATLTSSFDGMYDMFYGNDSTVMLRDSKAWMFKEVDAPMLGWEVYARKDSFYREKGIALIANATKLDALHQDPTVDDPNWESPLWFAMKAFVDNIAFGPYPPATGFNEGFQAVVVAVKASEAIRDRTRIELEDSWFELS